MSIVDFIRQVISYGLSMSRGRVPQTADTGIDDLLHLSRLPRITHNGTTAPAAGRQTSIVLIVDFGKQRIPQQRRLSVGGVHQFPNAFRRLQAT